jgi:hypothetical protein
MSLATNHARKNAHHVARNHVQSHAKKHALHAAKKNVHHAMKKDLAQVAFVQLAKPMKQKKYTKLTK